MSGHRRVKAIDYDDDADYDDYSDEDVEVQPSGAAGDDDLTEEDKEQLQLGTAKVRSILGESYQISNAAIEESLYYYFYDVEKTVTYLKNQHKPKEQKPKEQRPKEVSRFDQAAAASAAKTPVPASGESDSFYNFSRLGWDLSSRIMKRRVHSSELPTRTGSTYTEAIRDMRPPKTSNDPFQHISWAQPSPNHNAIFTPVERRPRLHLLGGSGKSSKLAELAKRRKENAGLATSNDNTSDAVNLLNRLGGKQPATTLPTRPHTLVDKAQTPLPEKRTISSLSARNKRPSEPTLPPTDEQPREEPAEKKPRLPSATDLSRDPSVFANTMCNTANMSGRLSATNFRDGITLALFGALDIPSQDAFLGPSPDAVVLQAQSKGKTTSQPSKVTKESKDTKQVTNGVESLSVSQSSLPPPPARIKSKNLNVAFEHANADAKRELNFVVVGHIDHGKSTLMGRLLYEHKVIDARSLEKYRKEAAKLGKESFHLAWVMDAREDEREHGVTIDYAEKSFSTPNTDFTIIDAPGHRDFVGNMIAGTSMADFALLVVDAGANSFAAGLKGQTREHAQVVRSHKLERIIVAINKMDSVSWSSESFSDIVAQTTQFLSEQLFNPAQVVFVPVSGLTGDNVVSPVKDKAPWYTGPTLVQALDAIQPKREQYLGKIADPFRLRIAGFSGLAEWAEFLGPSGHESFTAYGLVQSGNVQVGDRVTAQPSGESAVVKGILKHSEPVDYALPGQIIGLQLVECDEERFARGDLLCGADRPARATRKATLKVLAFQTLFPMPVDVHRGRMRGSAVITGLISRLDKETNAVVRNHPKRIKAGEVARVEVEFDEDVAIERPERLVLRYGGETIAAGAVEKTEG